MIKSVALPVKKLVQFNTTDDIKGVYSGLWKFVDILASVRFTYRVPKQEYNDLDIIPPKYARDETDYYQRLVADDRTSKIIDFLIEEFKSDESLITFPSSFIVSLPLTEILEIDEYKSVLHENEPSNFSRENLGVFYEKTKSEIVLPLMDMLLVVDGQHRLAALKALYYAVEKLLGNKLPQDSSLIEKTVDSSIRKLKTVHLDDEINLKNIKDALANFTIGCTLLLDFDIYEQGKVFADVNFNQKPVNRSLYYDIYGSFPNENRNEIFLLHKWCLALNSNPKSELKGKIKLLGNGNGYVSQAFLCDALLPYLRKGGIWYEIANNFTLEKQDDSKKIERFLIAFFNAFAKKYNKKGDSDNYYWPSENDKPRFFNSILLKTTGLGAIISLTPNIYNIVKFDLEKEIENLELLILDVINTRLTKEKLKEIYANQEDKLGQIDSKVSGEYYFSKTSGEFSGGAGKGLQSKLSKELLRDLNFTKIVAENKQFDLF